MMIIGKRARLNLVMSMEARDIYIHVYVHQFLNMHARASILR